ncbi:helix-turn-helix domain-containing protein [Pseudonocardia xishanensis]|uniref:Helix-turn-helix domain-containing protein n=1 Tax=Pseudonocardia xishanensis TaxID=630995 RepID=A0ABP8RK71_9PSEU
MGQDTDRTARTRRPEGRLLRAAEPVLERLAAELDGTRSGVLLADSGCRVVDVRCVGPALAAAVDDVGVGVGVSLREEDVGANSIGTAFELRRGVVVRGAQHAADGFAAFSCYGHPILHPVTGRIEGTVTVTSSCGDDENPLYPSLARQAVRDVEQRLLEDSPGAQQRLLTAFRAAKRRYGGAVVALGEDVVLATQAALDLLGPGDYAMLRDRGGSEATVTLSSGLEVLTRRPPTTGDGLVLVLSESVTAPPAAVRVPRWPLLVVGEPGTGRTTTARDGLGPERVELDAVDVVRLGEQRWARRVAAVLRGPGPGVLVENVHLLSELAAHDLARHLGATIRRVVLTAAPEPRLSSEHLPLLSACAERRDLTPLRRRRHEVASLAERMLRGSDSPTSARFAPSTLRLLAEQPWPGNLSELRRTVEAAAAARSCGDIIPADIPGPLHSGDAPSGPREQAERDVIVETIAAVDGSKVRAAKVLGISRSTLYNRLRALRIEP